MGWLYTDKHQSTSVADFFKNRWNQETDTKKVEVLACAVVKLKTAYIALRVTRKESNTSVTYAIIVLLDYVKGKRYNNFGYKDMSELEGPNMAECPQTVMKLLSPVEDVAAFFNNSGEYAKNWRERVQAHHDTTKKAKGFFEAGASYVLQDPVKMTNGLEVKEMRVTSTKPLLFFSTEHGFLFKLSRDLVLRAINNGLVSRLT